MNTFPYIILLKGKLCVIELPEKPKENCHECGFICKCQQAYESDRSAAIEKRIEIENPEAIHGENGVDILQDLGRGRRGIKEGEEVRWPGPSITYYQIKETSGEWVNTHDAMYERFPPDRKRLVARLIAPEQNLNSAHGYSEGSEIFEVNNNQVTRIIKPEPVSSETHEVHEAVKNDPVSMFASEEDLLIYDHFYRNGLSHNPTLNKNL